MLQIEHDMFAHATHLHDSPVLQRRSDLGGSRFQWLRFFSQPDGVDHVASDSLVESTGNGFDFWKFGHKLLVYGGNLPLSECYEV